MNKVSIIVCTYNPRQSIFKRCLQALDELQYAPKFGCEIIIVDNNSDCALQNEGYITSFISRGDNRTLISEKNPGLTYARLTGFRRSVGEILTFVDDDNVLEGDYAQEALRLMDIQPDVGAVGAGIIDVEWETTPSRWLRGYASVFQAKRFETDQFGRTVGWANFYPPGTGLVVRRNVMQQYADEVNQGVISAADRQGRKLTSAGDAQIIYAAVKTGYRVGVSPRLRLTHLISRRKARTPYVFKLVFGVMAGGQVALAESFPEQKFKLAAEVPKPGMVYWLLTKNILHKLFLLRLRSGPLDIIRQLGQLYGSYMATGRKPPRILVLAAKCFKYA